MSQVLGSFIAAEPPASLQERPDAGGGSSGQMRAAATLSAPNQAPAAAVGPTRPTFMPSAQLTSAGPGSRAGSLAAGSAGASAAMSRQTSASATPAGLSRASSLGAAGGAAAAQQAQQQGHQGQHAQQAQQPVAPRVRSETEEERSRRCVDQVAKSEIQPVLGSSSARLWVCCQRHDEAAAKKM